MKTILISAYAVNPSKGSEDGMGWNYIVQAAVNNKVIAITRRNNRQGIEQYINKQNEEAKDIYNRITFMYFDLPKWMLFWKKGPMLSMIYYYIWQLCLVVWLRIKKTDCDIVHNLNFHNDWTPSFLWLLNKKFVWGPVGHHPRIPVAYLKVYGAKEIVKDRLLWALKWSFWNLDPFLAITKRKADYIWCMHQEAADKLKLRSGYFTHPSIAAPSVNAAPRPAHKFTVLSVGRFVPLKGFDVTIKAFAAFYRALPRQERSHVRLSVIGKGPQKKFITDLLISEGVSEATNLIDWISQDELAGVYQTANVFLFPSHEGAGMVVAEAMRYDVPVLCWDNIGPGTIVHPDSELKVAYDDYDTSVTAFARKLYKLYRDKIFYNKESELAGSRFAKSLSWDVKSTQLTQFYNNTATQVQL